MDLQTRETLIKTFLPTAVLVLIYVLVPGRRIGNELKLKQEEARRLISEDQLVMKKNTFQAGIAGQRKELKQLNDDLKRLIRNNPALIEKITFVLDDHITRQVETLTAFMTASGLRVIEDGPVERRGAKLPVYLEPYEGLNELEQMLVKSKLDTTILQVSESQEDVAADDAAATQEHMPRGLLWRVELAGSYAAMQRMLGKLNEMQAVVPHAINMTTPLNERIIKVTEDRARASADRPSKLKPNETHWVIELWI